MSPLPTTVPPSSSWNETTSCQLRLWSLAWRSLASSNRRSGDAAQEAVRRPQGEQQEPPDQRAHAEWGLSPDLPPRLPVQHPAQRIKAAISTSFKTYVQTSFKASIPSAKSREACS